MKLATITHKDGSITMQVVIELEGGNVVESLSLSEWSKLIANPIQAEEHDASAAPHRVLI